MCKLKGWGKAMRKVEVHSYNKQWKHLFDMEAEKLKVVFGDALLEVHHIGSTAVPGLSAKPIIDLMPVVRDIQAVDLFQAEMEDLGYEALGENGLPGRRYFQKGGDDRTHHVHVYEKENQEINRHLLFRDYLRTNPEEAKVYGDLKERLAATYPFNIEAYIKGKHALVQKLEQEALRWGKHLPE
jgi:GrpB-like predicted nucleotidyltransferase (UPF0157 family)